VFVQLILRTVVILRTGCLYRLYWGQVTVGTGDYVCKGYSGNGVFVQAIPGTVLILGTVSILGTVCLYTLYWGLLYFYRLFWD